MASAASHSAAFEMDRVDAAPGTVPEGNTESSNGTCVLPVAQAAVPAVTTSSATDAVGEDEENLCVVCLDELTSHVVQPCGHKVLCGVCAQRLCNDGTSKCVICRGTVTRYEAPDGTALERKLVDGFRSNLSQLNRRELTPCDRVWLVILFCLYIASVIVAVVMAVVNHRQQDTSLLGLTLHIGLAMSGAIWGITAALYKTSYGMSVMVTSGIDSIFLIIGMWTLSFFTSREAEIEIWEAIVFGVIVTAVAMAVVGSFAATVHTALVGISWLLLKSWMGGALLTGCLLASIGICLNPPLHILIACADPDRVMRECDGPLGVGVLVWGLVVWVATLILLRVTLYCHPELLEQNFVNATDRPSDGEEGAGDGMDDDAARAAALAAERAAAEGIDDDDEVVGAAGL